MSLHSAKKKILTLHAMPKAEKEKLGKTLLTAKGDTIYGLLERLALEVLVNPHNVDVDHFKSIFGNKEQTDIDFEILKNTILDAHLPKRYVVDLFTAISAAAREAGAIRIADRIDARLAEEPIREEIAEALLVSDHASSGFPGNRLGRLQTVADALTHSSKVTKQDIEEFKEGFEVNQAQRTDGGKHLVSNREMLQEIIHANHFPQTYMALTRRALTARAEVLGVNFPIPGRVQQATSEGKLVKAYVQNECKGGRQ